MQYIRYYPYKVIKFTSVGIGVALLGACANSGSSMPMLSDLGTRYWQGTYYLSVKGRPSSIQCDIDPSFKVLDDVPVRYKDQNAVTLFDSDDDQVKINQLKQKCLDKSIVEAAVLISP